MFTRTEADKAEQELTAALRERELAQAKVDAARAKLKRIKRGGVDETVKATQQTKPVAVPNYLKEEPDYPGRLVNGRWVFPGEADFPK